MFPTTTEHNIGSTKYTAESIPCYATQNNCVCAVQRSDALSHCFPMLRAEFSTLIIRWCRVRLSGGPPNMKANLFGGWLFFYVGSKANASSRARSPSS